MTSPRPYPKWRANRNGRWRDAFHTFGHLIMTHARDNAVEEAAAKAPEKVRNLAQKVAVAALYNVMMILDGVVVPDGDDDNMIQFVLTARVRRRSKPYKIVEEFELAPEGEEPACMGFHFWTEGDFQH